MAGCLGIVVLACMMPTGESFWIDETSTQLYASEPTLGAFKTRLVTENGSETQMPLGMLAFWGWEKIAGSSEWGLRALNIVWTLLAAAALYLIGRRLRLPVLPFWLIVQPFLWFYANEARPYVMQIAGAAWLLHGMIACIQTRASGSLWAFSFLVGAIVTAGASMLGAVSLFSVMVIMGGFLVVSRSCPSRPAFWILGAGALLLAALGLYDLHTLSRGAGGTKIWNVGGVNAAFAGYELFGFLGLGPGRLEIREAARSGVPALITLFKPFGAGLGAMALLTVLLFLPITRGIDRERRLLIGLTALYAALSSALLLIAACIAGFPFWGRHLAFALPAWTILTAWAATRLNEKYPGRPLARGIPLVLAVLLLTSSLSLRLAGRHRKEDYRGAASITLQTAGRGGRIGWAADARTARYYGVSFTSIPGTGGAFEIHATLPERFASDMAVPLPDAVILSKPDLFDPDGRLIRWLAANHYELQKTFPGFTIWSR
jgi:hypothetical protein